MDSELNEILYEPDMRFLPRCKGFIRTNFLPIRTDEPIDRGKVGL